MDNLHYMIGVIVGFIGSMVFQVCSMIVIYLKDRARYLDKKDYKEFNKWKEKQK